MPITEESTGVIYVVLGLILLILGIAVSWRLIIELIGVLVAALGVMLFVSGLRRLNVIR
ncbi:MAG: hypothetical protein NZ988_04460 [Thaumarchaeota archaeon]|nr:hypothetical protein [Candidatus Calditenuaceae archaeon]MDW8187280.1 hypothetical protein [Nitrososphaerota archaeon]